MTTEEIWQRKSDDEVVAAAKSLDDFTEIGRQIILSEMRRRSLTNPPSSPQPDIQSIERGRNGGPLAVVPQTKGEWKALRNNIKPARPEDYPAIPREQFEAFRREVLLVTGATPVLWSAIGLFPGLFLVLPDNVLNLVRWGGIPWTLSALAIIVGNVVAGRMTRKHQDSALVVGKSLGILRNR